MMQNKPVQVGGRAHCFQSQKSYATEIELKKRRKKFGTGIMEGVKAFVFVS